MIIATDIPLTFFDASEEVVFAGGVTFDTPEDAFFAGCTACVRYVQHGALMPPALVGLYIAMYFVYRRYRGRYFFFLSWRWLLHLHKFVNYFP